MDAVRPLECNFKDYNIGDWTVDVKHDHVLAESS